MLGLADPDDHKISLLSPTEGVATAAFPNGATYPREVDDGGSKGLSRAVACGLKQMAPKMALMGGRWFRPRLFPPRPPCVSLRGEVSPPFSLAGQAKLQVAFRF